MSTGVVGFGQIFRQLHEDACITFTSASCVLCISLHCSFGFAKYADVSAMSSSMWELSARAVLTVLQVAASAWRRVHTQLRAPQHQLVLPVDNIFKGFGDLFRGGFSWLAGWGLWGADAGHVLPRPAQLNPPPNVLEPCPCECRCQAGPCECAVPFLPKGMSSITVKWLSWLLCGTAPEIAICVMDYEITDTW